MLKPATMSIDDFCAAAAQIGFDAIELWRREDDFELVARSARRFGLGVAGFIGHGALRDGLNKSENHDRIEAELRQSIDLAAEHGIPGIICFAGNRNPGQSDLEGMIQCAKGLRRVAEHAERRGVNLQVELLNSKVDHPGYQCDRTDWGLALCEMVNSPRVKLLFDIYHMQIMEGDLIRSIGKAIHRIGHFHTAGNPGRQNINAAQEINYAAVCQAIAQTGYDGFIGHEFRPAGDVMAAMRQAFTTCAGGSGEDHA
jgi:hydroxypyruvate isomerase